MQAGKKETDRLEIFSDGVFAIAITLLVLELIQTFHPAEGKSLLESLVHHWRSFLAFTLGFVTLLICWINHHITMEYIVRKDTRFMWINGFLLFVVTLTPFPTAILAEYLAEEPNTALAIFGFNYILISVAAFAICSYSYNHNLVDESKRKIFNCYRKLYFYSIIYTVAAFLLCFVSMILPIIMYFVLFLAFSSPGILAKKLMQQRGT